MQLSLSNYHASTLKKNSKEKVLKKAFFFSCCLSGQHWCLCACAGELWFLVTGHSLLARFKGVKHSRSYVCVCKSCFHRLCAHDFSNQGVNLNEGSKRMSVRRAWFFHASTLALERSVKPEKPRLKPHQQLKTSQNPRTPRSSVISINVISFQETAPRKRWSPKILPTAKNFL